jgi:DNA primase
MLCALPSPHGEFFLWLESVLQDHGRLSLEELSLGAKGQPFEELISRWLADSNADADCESDSAAELRDLMNRIQLNQIKVEQTAAIEVSKSDPLALDRYRELQAKRNELEKTINQGIIQG